MEIFYVKLILQIVSYLIINKDEIRLTTVLNRNMSPDEKNINDLDHKIWIIILPNNKNKKININHVNYENELFHLNFNDLIKLGRVKYVITDLFINGKLQSIEDKNSNSIFNLILNHDETIDNKDISCLFCLDHYANDESPLLNMCKCKQSLSLHLTCVKKFIEYRLNIKKNECKYIFLSSSKS